MGKCSRTSGVQKHCFLVVAVRADRAPTPQPAARTQHRYDGPRHRRRREHRADAFGLGEEQRSRRARRGGLGSFRLIDC